MCRSRVRQQGAFTGDAVVKHQVWHSGSRSGPKGGNHTEMFQRCGFLVSEGRVQSHHCTDGWRICSLTQWFGRTWSQVERDIKGQTCWRHRMIHTDGERVNAGHIQHLALPEDPRPASH